MRLHSRGIACGVSKPALGRLTTVPIADRGTRQSYIIYGEPDALTKFEDYEGYAAALCKGDFGGSPIPLPVVESVRDLDWLGDGDVVHLRPDGSLNVLFRRSSRHNTILATERCNSRCLMCSQPPRNIDDSYRAQLVLRLIELIDPSADQVTLSGGEPTLLGDRFIEIAAKFARALPNTALHVLSNARLFKDAAFAQQLAAVNHPDLVLGIPLYSDVDTIHDFVVQAQGAFFDTIEGLYNLAERGLRLEIRIVLTQQTYQRLPQWAEFVYRNFPFVEHVALMGLEPVGLAKANHSDVWIDPARYSRQLEEAALALALRGMNVSVYNHQLCVLPRSLWPYAVRSISDWKNVYHQDCGCCGARSYCGGFFESALERDGMRPTPVGPLSSEAEAHLKARV